MVPRPAPHVLWAPNAVYASHGHLCSPLGLLTVLTAGVDCRRGQSDVLTAAYLDDTRALELPRIVSMDPRAWSAEGVKECQDQLNHVVSLTLAADTTIVGKVVGVHDGDTL